MTESSGWLEDWLRLTLIPGVGSATQRKLLQHYGTPGDALRASRAEVAPLLSGAARAAWSTGADAAEVARALDWASQPNHRILVLGDADYPKTLLEIPDPPMLLYVSGDTQQLGRPMIAIVGSRNATPQGQKTAQAFARTLSDAGLTIVSGLALGIDAAAHRGGLEGASGTVAITGTGPDLVYPARNRDLARTIAAEGAVATEFPLGTAPNASNFPRRNRLISGLARGVLVVEAAMQSGSLTTARMAGEQGREVMAVPGSIHSPLSRGCHSLIKQGAKLVETAEDVLEELGWGSSAAPQAPEAPAEGEADPLLSAMGFDPCDVETLSARAGLAAQDVVSRLLSLELDGRVVTLPGGRYQRVS